MIPVESYGYDFGERYIYKCRFEFDVVIYMDPYGNVVGIGRGKSI